MTFIAMICMMLSTLALVWIGNSLQSIKDQLDSGD
jgi:hypothetical protein